MIYVQVYNDCGLKIDEVEVRDDQSILDAIANSGWYLDPGDTLKIVEEDE